MSKKGNRVIEFETEAWGYSEPLTAEARRVLVQISEEHVKNGYWRRFSNPISLALNEHLADDTCSDLFWNSDSFAPRYPEDDARIGVYMELYDQQTGCFINEVKCYVPLPQRATRAMWKLRSTGEFEPFTMAIDLPAEMLRQPTGQ